MAASLRFDPWSPPRPFPVHRWQRQRFAFRVSLPPATPRPQPLTPEQRRELELRLLVSECEIGMTTIQTPFNWLSRPARNHALALRAARLGQLTAAMERCPKAEPLAQEAEHAFAVLRR